MLIEFSCNLLVRRSKAVDRLIRHLAVRYCLLGFDDDRRERKQRVTHSCSLTAEGS